MTNEKPVIDVPVISWFGEPVKQSVKSVFDGINQSVEAKDLFKKYRRAHFRSLRRRMQHVKILGMSSPVKLAEIYEPAMVSTTIYRRLYEVEWLKAGGEHADEVDTRTRTRRQADLVRADSFIEKTDRVVILGGPGSGKTTLLKYLAFSYLDRKTFKNTKLRTSKFPIFIRLPHLADLGVSLEEYAMHGLQDKTDKYARAFLRRVFKNGYATLILDSLDEVASSQRAHVYVSIREFCDKYPGCAIIVSCRTADYESIDESFHEVELAHLTKAAISRIVGAWFGENSNKASRLLRHLKHDEDIAQLTETPLLLSLLCIQFHHDMALPKRKAELYGRCIDALLRDWDASRGFRRETAYESLSDDRKERLFEHVADHFFHPTPVYVLPEKELVAQISSYCERFGVTPSEGRGVLREIESHHGLIEKVSKDSYVFSHPSFQEFFTGRCALARRTDLAIVKQHFEHEDWASVIEFVVALREDPEELVRYMLKKSSMSQIKTYPAMARRTTNLWLLYRCLAAGAALSADTTSEVYKNIVVQQINMAGIYWNGGVFPYASLMSDGVRHSYFFYRRRPTLAKALEPLRKLGNAIYSAPSPVYSRLALDSAKGISETISVESVYNDVSLALSLAIPVAHQFPDESVELLVTLKSKIHEAGVTRHFLDWIDESISNLE